MIAAAWWCSGGGGSAAVLQCCSGGENPLLTVTCLWSSCVGADGVCVVANVRQCPPFLPLQCKHHVHASPCGPSRVLLFAAAAAAPPADAAPVAVEAHPADPARQAQEQQQQPPADQQQQQQQQGEGATGEQAPPPVVGGGEDYYGDRGNDDYFGDVNIPAFQPSHFLTFVLQPNEVQTFYQTTTDEDVGQLAQGNYFVLNGGDLSIDFKVRNWCQTQRCVCCG